MVEDDESQEGLYPELERLFHIWKENADEIYPFLRPPLTQDYIPVPKLLEYYHDVYNSLLIGRYSASIVLMGVLLEAVVKERIRITTGEDYRKPFSPCIDKLKKDKLMRNDDIFFLTRFKNKIRNPYQHVDDYEILKDKLFPIWPIKFKDDVDINKLKNLIHEVKKGGIEPKYLHAAEIPAIRGPVRCMYDKRIVVDLFNEIHDFLIGIFIRYFKKEEYDKYHKMYGSGLKEEMYYEI